MEREAWYAAVHGVTKSQTQLSNWTELSITLHIYIYTHTFCLSIHRSVDTWVAFTLWPLCIVLLMNMRVQRSQGQDFDYFEYILRGGLLSPAVILYVTVKNYSPVFHGGCKEPFCIPTIRAQEFQFLHILTSTYFLFVFLFVCLYSVQFSHSVMPNSLRPHGLQHTRLPCPSPTPRVCSNSWASSQWSHPTLSSSVFPFSSCLQSSQHQGLFQWVSFLHPVTKVLECQLQHQTFQWIFRTDFHLNACVVCAGLYLSPFCKWGKRRQRETKEPAQGYILIMQQ